MTSRAYNNKKTGARFEGDIRKALRSQGYFIYTKGVSSKGIDVFAQKENQVIQLELKSHKNFINSEYQEAANQLIANYEIVKNFIHCTNYKKENIIYRLVYYIRNDKLIISDIYDNKVEYFKTRNINITNFLISCFNSSEIII